MTETFQMGCSFYTGAIQENYLEIVLTWICSHATYVTSRGSYIIILINKGSILFYSIP